MEQEDTIVHYMYMYIYIYVMLNHMKNVIQL